MSNELNKALQHTLRKIDAASCPDCEASGYTDHGVPDSPDGPGRPPVVCNSCKGTTWRNGVHLSDQHEATSASGSLRTFLEAADRAGITRLPASLAADLAATETDTVPRSVFDEVARERDLWKAEAKTMAQHQRGECWYWQGDGEDHLESLVNSLPVVIRADQLRELLAAAAPAVPDIEAAAEKLAECMDYSWEAMTSASRYNMCKHAEAVLSAAQAKGGQ